MLNRKIGILAIVVILVGMVGAIDVSAADSAKVNINTASAEELTQLKGVGPSHAVRIVEFREKNGPFKNPEGLIQVPGIGQKTFEKNKDTILIEDPKQN
jgi:competence protein ComEA